MNNWGEVAKITGADQTTASTFGWSVGICNDHVVVGARGHNSSGAAYLFGRNQGGADNWGQVVKVTAWMPRRPTSLVIGGHQR